MGFIMLPSNELLRLLARMAIREQEARRAPVIYTCCFPSFPHPRHIFYSPPPSPHKKKNGMAWSHTKSIYGEPLPSCDLLFIFFFRGSNPPLGFCKTESDPWMGIKFLVQFELASALNRFSIFFHNTVCMISFWLMLSFQLVSRPVLLVLENDSSNFFLIVF